MMLSQIGGVSVRRNRPWPFRRWTGDEIAGVVCGIAVVIGALLMIAARLGWIAP